MAMVKRALDPALRCNPGKAFPMVAEDCPCT